jgi:hypothetical protein
MEYKKCKDGFSIKYDGKYLQHNLVYRESEPYRVLASEDINQQLDMFLKFRREIWPGAYNFLKSRVWRIFKSMDLDRFY